MSTITEERRPTTPDTTPEAASPRDTRSWLQDEVAGRWAFGLLAAWYGFFLLAQYLQPAPHDVSALLEWIGIALSVVFTAVLLVAGIGLAMRRRWGLVASIGAAALLIADTVACPMTGHHQFGTWVLVQAVGAIALAGASIRALRQT